MSVSFNTTSVATLDKLGKLYKTAIPLSDDPASEALVYSTSAIAENKLVPTTAVYLKNNDALSNDDKSFFSIDLIGKNINLVAAGTTLNLYVYNAPGTGELAGSIDKYQFDAATGVQKDAVPALINPIDIAKEELIANRDLDGNAGIGGLLPSTNSTLDKVGNLFKVKVAGQDMLIVGAVVSAKSKSIDIAANVLKTSDGMAWMPEVAYDSYSAVKSANGWEVFAVKNGSGVNQPATVTKYSFDANRELVVNDFSDSKLLTASELATFEKSYGRNLNNDSFMGVAITESIDAKGGLYKANILNEEFYVVDTTTTGKGLKSGTTAATALDLSGTLMADDGVAAWKEPAGFTLSSMVKGAGGSSLKVFLTKNTETSPGPKTVLQFDFNLDIASGNFLVDGSTAEGIEVDPIALAEIEKATKRDLNKDGEFGIKVGTNLDKVGGLYMAEALGRTYLVAGKNIVSNAKNITDLASALTMNGAAWKPEGLADDALAGKINIVIDSSGTSATVYVKDPEGFAKYDFTRTSTEPWSTDGERISLDNEEMAEVERTTKRDLNNDNMYGARIVSLKDASGGLYTASYDTLGSESSNPIFIRSSTKLSLGASTAANAVSFSSALKTGSDFWKPPEGYAVTGAYQDPSASANRYHVIVVNNESGTLDTSDFKRYSFNTDSNAPATFNSLDESSSTALSDKELSVIESQLKRDLNDDKVIGAKVLATIDKVGLLFKVQGPSKDISGDPVVTFATKATATSSLNNLSTSFVLENGEAWQPANLADNTKLTLIKRTSGSTVTGYDIYTKNADVVDPDENVFAKYSFDANYTLKSETAVNLVDLANDETHASRDINGDGVIGAKVLNAIDKAAGLYRVSIENKFMMVSASAANPPVKQTSLRSVLLGESSSPIQLGVNSEILDEVGVTTGFKVRSAFIDPLDATLFKVFATKTNGNQTDATADDFSDVKQITFKINTNAIDYKDYKRVETSAVLDAKSLVEAEKASGKDLNTDLSIGVKISAAVDKSGGLYSTKVLGSTYYFYDALNKKSGTSASTAIDLSRAFLDDNSDPWKLETGFSIGGVVKNDSNGYDIYTYKKNSSSYEYEVKKHSWDDEFVFIGTQAADAAALVNVEKDNARDFSGDNVVGFKLINNPSLKGVTEAKVLGGIEAKFLIVGDKLKPGTPTAPWKLSDALLNQEGSGPWAPPAGFTVTAARDAENNRYVYAKTEVNTTTVNKYIFDKTTGKFSGTEQTLDAVQLAAEEIQFSKDLNGDTKLGVYSFSDVKIGLTSNGSDLIGSGAGKSSGLMKSTVNGINYLVAQMTPNPNARVNLELALLNQDGSAWMPESGFTLAGMYKPEASGKTEVYGNVNGSLRRYEFNLSNMVSDSVATELGYSSTPQVLKLSKQTINGIDVNFAPVTDIQLADREHLVQKDLNNDNLVGFKVGTKIDTLANGTTLTNAGMGSGANLSQIYVVGKSVATMGSVGYGTANANALRVESGGVKSYWQPDINYEVKSVLESTDSMKVYAAIKSSSLSAVTAKAAVDEDDTFDPNQMLEYTFAKDGTQGWLLQSSEIRNSDWLIAAEVSSKRDLNKDTNSTTSGIGLAYKNTDTFNIANSGLIKGTFGDKQYIFAGQNLSTLGTFAKPLGLNNVGGPQLLKDALNKAWSTTDAILSFAAKTSNTGIPTNINSSQVAYVLTHVNNQKVYFDSSYKALTASPVLNTSIDLQDKTLKEDVKFSFYLPEFATAAVDDYISYTAEFADGTEVPNDSSQWFSFNPSTGNFTGTPTNANVTGTDLTVTVKAWGSDNTRFISSSFKVTVDNVNDAPVRATGVAVNNVNLEVGSGFSFDLPEGAFTDDDTSDTITYSYTDDAGGTQSWLNFDSTTQRFTGTVPANWGNSSLTITVKASDARSNEVETSYATASFTINFNNKPTADVALVNQIVTIGQAFEYLLDSPFSDLDSDTLTLSAKQSNGADLPTWLAFDGSKFTYTPTVETPGPSNDLIVKVIASDGKNSTAESTFNITVNEAPKLVYPLDDIFVTENTSGSFVIPANSFVDPDGTALTYTAKLQDGSELPSDLEFNPDTRTFTYSEYLTLTTALSIKVTASDGSGTSSSTFKLEKQ